jgi:hypothetical protein
MGEVDIVGRVRWGNVALACVVVAALAGVVVWPLTASGPPALPPDSSRPLIAAAPPPVRTATASATPGMSTAPRTERSRKRDGKPPRRKRRRAKRERPAATPRPVPTVAPRRVVPAAPPSAPIGEFGFER